jgi:hypothetical protein
MKDQSSSKRFAKNLWSLLVVSFVILAVGTVLGSYIFDPETGMNLSLNLASEALGTVAGVLFIQRYLDIVNQRESDKTNRMLSTSFGKLRQLINEKNNSDTKHKLRRRYSSRSSCRKKRSSLIHKA